MGQYTLCLKKRIWCLSNHHYKVRIPRKCCTRCRIKGIRWIIKGIRLKWNVSKKKRFEDFFVEEIFTLLKKDGFAIQEKNKIHLLAKQNRKRIKYRW